MPARGRYLLRPVEPDARPSSIDSVNSDDCHEEQFIKQFVEQYLTSRGYHVCTRNARVIVAAIADCRPAALDWAALERCVDRSVDSELLRRAA